MHENWDERKMGGGDTLLFQICYLGLTQVL